MGDGDARRDRAAARMATSAAEPACEGRRATKDDDCDAGAECGALNAAICRAMAVREMASRAPFDEKKCRDSGKGLRTVALSCGDATRLGNLLESASTS